MQQESLGSCLELINGFRTADPLPDSVLFPGGRVPGTELVRIPDPAKKVLRGDGGNLFKKCPPLELWSEAMRLAGFHLAPTRGVRSHLEWWRNSGEVTEIFHFWSKRGRSLLEYEKNSTT